MEGISKQYLKNSLVSIKDAPIDDAIKSAFAILVEKLIAECQELQEPWIPLDEFLKSGFDGWCWINTPYDRSTAYFECGVFYWNDLRDQVYQGVTHVMPIHKPDPPNKLST